MTEKARYNIVFEELYAGLAEHALPVIQQLGGNPDVQIHVVGKRSELDRLRAVYAAYAGSISITLHDFDTFTWDIPVHAMFSTVPGSPGPLFRDVNSPLNIPRIAMPHGLTDKYNKFPAHFIGNPLGYFNVLMASGEAMYTGSWAAYEKKHPQVRFSLRHVQAGVPKTDRLFNEQHTREAVLRDLGLDPLRETILYAPTYQPEASLEQNGEEIQTALAGTGVNVLVRLHHLSTTRDAGHAGRDWDAFLQDMQAKHPNMKYVKGDSTPYFIAADLLVGDVSGACYEFIVQDKPVIFIDAPKFFDKHGKDGIAWWGRDAGIVVSNTEKLEEIVFSQLDKPDVLQTARRNLIRRLLYRQGDAAEYVSETIINMLRGKEAYPLWGPQAVQREDRLMEEYIIQRLHALACENKRMAVYGCGRHTERILKLMQKAEGRSVEMPKIVCFLNDAITGQEKTAFRSPVMLPQEADASSFDAVLLSSDYFQTQMSERCAELWGRQIQRIDLYENFPWHRPDSLLV